MSGSPSNNRNENGSSNPVFAFNPVRGTGAQEMDDNSLSGTISQSLALISGEVGAEQPMMVDVNHEQGLVAASEVEEQIEKDADDVDTTINLKTRKTRKSTRSLANQILDSTSRNFSLEGRNV